MLRIFDALNDSVGADRIFTLGGGDIFTFDGAFYEVLSPARNEPFPFDAILTEAVENLNICLSSPFHTGRETEFLETKDAFVRLYMQCQTAFAPSDRATPGRRRILLDSLRDLLGRMEDMRSNLAHSPAAPDIQDILNQSVVRNVYTETQNDLSLVFHNRRSRGPSNLDILMTGDVSDEVLRRISGKLFDGYYIVKAPHHGTESHFSNVIGDLAVAHLLISNGDYHAGGEISQRYIDMECIKHCTKRRGMPLARHRGRMLQPAATVLRAARFRLPDAQMRRSRRRAPHVMQYLCIRPQRRFGLPLRPR